MKSLGMQSFSAAVSARSSFERDFHQMTDEEVTALLARAAQPTAQAPVAANTTAAEAS
jgi:predicted phosphoribosyltransferase